MITNPELVIMILGALLVILAVWLVRLELRLKKIFSGKKAGDFEGVINKIIDDISDLDSSRKKIFGSIDNIEGRLKRSVQGLGIVRFNAFKTLGGNQSFSIALLNETGDGLVLSSIYSREHVSVYAKPIRDFSSEFDLTQEEKDALKKARVS
jgi:hypothetical protein